MADPPKDPPALEGSRHGLPFSSTRSGSKDEALRWIEKGMKARFGFLLWLKGTPGFAILHGDPRFEAIVGSLKLPA